MSRTKDGPMQVACFDLETSSLKANFGVVLCGVVRPLHGQTKVFRIDDDARPGLSGVDLWSDDSSLVSALIDELRQYLILIAHNGVSFDRRFLNARATRWRIPPLDPRGRIIDPVTLARRHLAVSWNGLESLSVFLETKHRKSPVDGGLWLRAILDHDMEALDAIVKHCVLDVLVLEEVATRLQPYVGRIQEWGSA